MSLKWYIARIRSMSVPEIAFRVGEHVERSRMRRKSKVFVTPPKHLELRRIPGFEGRVIGNATPAFRKKLDVVVANIFEGKFSALGATWPDADPEDLFPEKGWRIDPGTGLLWPGSDSFSFDIKYRRSGELGDIKHVWEKNRLQFLQALAAAASLNHDRRALAAVEDAIASWARHNPPYTGVGWNSGIEVALRCVSLIVAYNLCADRLSERTRRLILEILLSSRDFLERFPSKFSSANNHAMAEHLGLLLIEATVRKKDGNLQRARHQYEHIAREAALQILPDGTPAEQSPTYGAFTAEMILFGNFVADKLALGVSEVATQRLLAFAGFVAAISEPGGSVPAIGDDDEGRVLTLDAVAERSYVCSVAQTIQAAYDDLGPCHETETEELRNALFGCSRLSRQTDRRLQTFMQGGYTVVTDRQAGRHLHLVIDHGPLGYLSIAAHGHADANAVVFSIDGEAVLCDPGTYLYHGGGAWRTWFRGTAAHNTLCLGGVDQSTISGPFNWGHKAHASLVEKRDGENWRVRVTHDGYRSRFGVDHVRTIEAAPFGFALIDELQPGPGPEEASIAFQFAPGIVIDDMKTALVFLRDGRQLGRLSFDRPGNVTVQEGENRIDGGWVSNRFGEMRPAPRVVWRGHLPSGGLRTSFQLTPETAEPAARMRVLDGFRSS
ncbi:heparinase II/III-family protein [Methylobacterium sp. WL9]|uniref:heparinase II/III family protein n=1 Tax=Methylobacterium sp. WL9 TaxID=2603898 RepID=UPI0011CB3F7A|nr:heparinase II/III-family protein [Methylobacterium sp. WL9]TXN21518.1 heparinase [Methylobacterium sp. WL9]